VPFPRRKRRPEREAVAVLIAAAAAAALTVAVSPAPAAPGGLVHVDVHGLAAPSALVVVHGGIARRGRWFRWVPLASRGTGRWTATLRTPGFLGVYPLRLRVGHAVRPTNAVVRVLPHGFMRQPGFDTPQQVAQWWAWIAPPGVVLKSVSTWRAGFYTHRDPTLNRLLRVRFRLLGDWRTQHLRRGEHVLYLSVARLRPGAPWRLVETVAAP
jgi:hypothetical protein